MQIIEKALSRLKPKEEELARSCSLEKNTKFFRKMTDPFFGEISIVQNSLDKSYLMLREKTTESKDVIQRFANESQDRSTIRHDYIVNLNGQSVTNQRSFCGNAYTLRQFFEFPRSDLQREIEKVSQIKSHFSAIKLTHIVYQSLYALQFIHEKGYYHGSVSPLAIGLISEDPVRVKLKLLGEEKVPKIKEIALRKIQNGAPLHISPGLFRSFTRRDIEFQIDPSSEDVFALGMTLLEAGLASSVQSVYSKDGVYDENELIRLKEEFRTIYEEEAMLLVSLLDNLLQLDDLRPTVSDLLQVMPKYQEILEYFPQS